MNVSVIFNSISLCVITIHVLLRMLLCLPPSFFFFLNSLVHQDSVLEGYADVYIVPYNVCYPIVLDDRAEKLSLLFNVTTPTVSVETLAQDSVAACHLCVLLRVRFFLCI